MRFKVHIVIVTYNGLRWLPKCLESIERSDLQARIVIVDNSSTDGTLEFIKQNYPNCLLKESQDNLGFGKANNIGIALALADGTDAVFLLNQDVYLDPNVISSLVKVVEEFSDIGIVSPMHMNGSGDAVDAGFSNYMNKAQEERSGAKELVEVPFVNAAAWLITRTTLLTVGGFDPSFPHYGEDADYCNRIHFHRFRIVVNKRVKVFHDRPQISSDLVDRSTLKAKNGIFVNFLALIKKPSDVIIVSAIKLILYAVYSILVEVINLRFVTAKYCLLSFWQVVLKFRTYVSSKNNTRKIGPHFLEITNL